MITFFNCVKNTLILLKRKLLIRLIEHRYSLLLFYCLVKLKNYVNRIRLCRLLMRKQTKIDFFCYIIDSFVES